MQINLIILSHGKIRFLLLIFGLLLSIQMHAQSKRKEINLDVEYYQPQGYSNHIFLTDIWFNNSILLKGSYLFSGKSGLEVMRWIGLTMTYTRQTPSLDTFFIDTSPSDYEYYVSGNRDIYTIGVKYKWETTGKSPFGILWGTEFGFWGDDLYSFHHFPGGEEYRSFSHPGIFFTPLLGLQYTKANGFGVFIQGRYELVFTELVLTAYVPSALSYGGGILYRF